MPACVALMAPDPQKTDLVALIQTHQRVLSHYHLIATDRTGQYIQEVTELPVERLASAVEGGLLEIASRVVSGEVIGVISLIDPRRHQPYQPDLQALLRVCSIHNVPIATNLAAAELAIRGVAKRRLAYLIFNPVAGQGNPDRDLTLIRQSLEPQVHLHTIFTEPDGNITEQVQEVIAKIQASQTDEDSGFIIASGGDGTISAIAGATINTGIPLGIIPRGTANAFAVALGVPTHLQTACDTIVAGNTRMIDAARCNDIPMILLAGVGFEAGMVDRANRELKNRLGTLAYLLSGAQQLFDQQPFQAILEIGGQVLEIQTPSVTVANVAPPTSVMAQGFGEVIPDDGLLEVTIPTPMGLIQGMNTVASLFTSALVKSQVERDDLVCLRTNQMKLTTNPPQKLVIDGELFDANPIEFECIPKGLTIFAPLLTV